MQYVMVLTRRELPSICYGLEKERLKYAFWKQKCEQAHTPT